MGNEGKYTLADLVQNKRKTRFAFCQNGKLHYRIDGTDIVYPVPAEDIGDSTLPAKDDALHHMKWIQSHLEALEQKEEIEGTGD